MPTQSERNVRHRKRRSGILVPLLEDLLQKPVRVENDRDLIFIRNLLKKSVERERTRIETPVFSPSSMEACLRKVYLIRHAKQLEIQPLKSTRMEPNFYFLKGEWTHIQWQFACFKLQDKIDNPDIFRLVDCEYRILSKRGDHGGTVDVFCLVRHEPLIVDFKGLNVRHFGAIVRGEASGYEIQLADYMMLYNSNPTNHANSNRVDRALLIAENKGGPDNNHPIALHETVIELDEHLPAVRHRLGVLRKHEAKEEIPKPECTSVTTFQFQGCPFRGFCREEVKAIQFANKWAENTEGAYQIARPSTSKRKRR